MTCQVWQRRKENNHSRKTGNYMPSYAIILKLDGVVYMTTEALPKENKLLTGPVAIVLMRLALPIMAGMFLQTAFNLVDTWFVSRLGQDAIAAVSMNIPLFFIVLAMGNAVAVGTSSLVAQAMGAGDRSRAARIAGQAVTLAVVLGVASGIVGVILTRPLMMLMGAEGVALEYAVDYTRIILAGNPIFFLYAALDGVLRGEGDMKTSMVILAIATVINIFLDPLFIFGWGPIPALGVGGAALATTLARGVGLVVLLGHFSAARSSIVFKLLRWQWDNATIIGILRIGIPTAISQAMLSLTMFVYNLLANQFGPHVVAALGLGFRIDSLAFMPGMAVSIATVTMVGQNYGARHYHRLVTAWRTALVMVFVTMGGMGVVIYFLPNFFVGIFTQEALVVEQTIGYLRVIPLFYGFLGMGIVTASAFQGLGRGLPALVVNMFRLGIVGIPLSILLTRFLDSGPSGIWWALALSDFSFAIVGIIWFMVTYRRLLRQEAIV